MKKTVQYLLPLVALLYLAGCVTAPDESTTSVEWQAHQQYLTQLDTFSATGKIGYRTERTNLSLNFNWQHSPTLSKLRLINILGKTVLTLTIDDTGAKIVTDDDKIYQHPDASVLFRQLSGLSFPVTQMQDWIKGLPSQADAYALNETHTVSSLNKVIDRQLWRLSYASYRDHNGTPMPAHMYLLEGETRVQIKINKWSIQP